MLDIDIWTLVWTGVNLVVLYLLLRRFLFKPVTEVMDRRSAAIKDELNRAEQSQRKAEELLTDREAQLTKARTEAEEILNRAKEHGQLEYQAMLDEANERVRRMVSDAQARGQAERDQMLHDARQEVAALALLAAAKVAGRAMDSDADRAFVSDFLAEVGESK